MFLSEMTGLGCKLIVREKGVPGQPNAVGITEYTTVCRTDELFDIVSVTDDKLIPLLAPET
jgi:hypothetical protein